ncbi:MAG: 50S ribosomal protein L10 [Gaiellales bacterium]
MLRAEKEEIVAELAERLSAASGLIVADYRGLSVSQLEELRGELIGQGARFSVCKNRLTRLAVKQAGLEELDQFLTGPTGIAFVTDGDMIAVAKALSETAKRTEVLTLKGGILDGEAVDAESVKALASLPPAEAIRAQLVAAIIGPASALVNIFSAPLRDLVGVLEARIRQLEEGGAQTMDGTSAPDPEAPGERAEEDGDSEAAGPVEDQAAAEPATSEDDQSAPEQEESEDGDN